MKAHHGSQRDSSLHQVSQHFVEDAAVAVVLDFDGGVDAAGGDEVDRGAVGFGGHDFDGLEPFHVVIELWGQPSRQPFFNRLLRRPAH